MTISKLFTYIHVGLTHFHNCRTCDILSDNHTVLLGWIPSVERYTLLTSICCMITTSHEYHIQ